jgi:tetratricopeptide (TPR) repeat protein
MKLNSVQVVELMNNKKFSTQKNVQVSFIAILVLFLVILSSCETEDNLTGTPQELYERATQYYARQDYVRAERLLIQITTDYPMGADGVSIRDVHRNLADISAARGRFTQAMTRFDNALNMCRNANDLRGEALVHLSLGRMQYELGEFSSAIVSNRTALSLFTALDDAGGKAISLEQEGNTYRMAGNYPEAERVLNESIQLYRFAKDSGGVGRSLLGLGELFAARKKYPEALTQLTLGTRTINRVSEPLLYGKTLLSLGRVYRNYGNAGEAVRCLNDALGALRVRRLDPELQVLTLFQLGRLYEGRGIHDAAIKYYRDAMTIAKRSGDRLASTYLQLFVARSQESRLTDRERDGKEIELAQTYSRVAAQFHEAEHAIGEAYALTLAGDYYDIGGNIQQAIACYERAVERTNENKDYISTEYVIPYLNELQAFEKRSRWRTTLADLYLRRGLVDRAVITLELAERHAAYERFRGLAINWRHPQLKEEIEATQSLIRQQALASYELGYLYAKRDGESWLADAEALRKQLSGLSIAIERRSEIIARIHPNYESFIPPGNVRIAELQQKISRGTVVCWFVPGRERLFGVTLTRSGIAVASTAIPGSRVRELVSEYNMLLHDPGVYTGSGGEESLSPMMRFETLSRQLYSILLKPIESRFDKNLLIIPTEAFDRFPFHALMRERANGESRFLIEETNVDYLPFLQALNYTTKEPVRLRKLIAFGNPSGKTWAIDYELRDIQSFFRNCEIRIGAEASWNNLAASKGDVLQLATDFTPDPGNSVFGTFTLSEGTSMEATIPVAFERLTDLEPYPVVVLANQSTAGIWLSMDHALLLRANGVSDIFFTEWYGDRRTMKFFSEFFYTHLANGLAPGDAFRQALLNLIKTRETRHPHSWACFFHAGQG